MKRRANITIAALVLALAALACVCSETGSEGSTGSSSGSSPAATPEVFTYEEIYDRLKDTTDAQFEVFSREFEGGWAENWEGEVSEVDAGEFLGGYTVYVELDDRVLGSDVFIEVDEETAISLNEGDIIVFSGEISSLDNTFDLMIRIEDATITVK